MSLFLCSIASPPFWLSLQRYLKSTSDDAQVMSQSHQTTPTFYHCTERSSGKLSHSENTFLNTALGIVSPPVPLERDERLAKAEKPGSASSGATPAQKKSVSFPKTEV